MAERAKLDLDNINDDVNEEGIDISTLAGAKRPKPTISRDELTKISEEAGFVSRQAPKRRRRGGRTAYTKQKNFKMRPDMSELFEDVADNLGVKDYELFEMALQAFLSKQKLKDEMERFKAIVSNEV